MKRSVLKRWSLTVVAVLFVITASLYLAGWRPNFDASVELSNRFGKVENGSAYDRATVELAGVKKVILPHDAVVRRVGEGGKLQLFMVKTLEFHGHPPKPMSIRDGRLNMGCAIKTEGETLAVATFGEWDSHIEGRTRMRLVVDMPEGLGLEQREGLSGEDSAGREWEGFYLSAPKEFKGGYWYGPASPADGWTAVPDVPDPARTAK